MTKKLHKRKSYPSLIGAVMLFLAMMVPLGAWGQETLTVYNGSTTNSVFPIYFYYVDAYTQSQVIYSKSNLSAMAGCNINSMKFYTSQRGNVQNGCNWQIYMAEVDSEGMSEIINLSNATKVYEGAIDNTVECPTVTFTTPFPYSGNKHLLWYAKNTNTGTFQNTYFYGVSGNVYAASYGGYGSYLNPEYFVPKTTFTYEQSGTKYDITAGTITPSHATGLSFSPSSPVGEGKTVTVTAVNPEFGWSISSLTVIGDGSGTTYPSTGNTFTMPGEDVTVSATMAQGDGEITIGDVSVNNDYAWVPIHPSDAYSMTEIIYNKSNFSDAVKIKKISMWTGNGTFNGYSYDQLKVYFTTTSKNNFSSDNSYVHIDNDGLAFSGTVVVPSDKNAKFDITLTTPYEYDPADGNLVVCIYRSGNKPGNTSTKPLYKSFASSYGARQWTNQMTGNVGDYNPTSASGDNQKVPVIRFTCELSAPTYAITKTETNCTISTKVGGSDVTEAKENDVVTLACTPNDHYTFNSWNVHQTESPYTTVTVTNNQFTMPAYAVTVEANLTQDQQYAVTYVDPDHATLAGDALAYEGSTVNVTVTPAPGWAFESLVVKKTSDSSPVGEYTEPSFTMPGYAVTVTATTKVDKTVKFLTENFDNCGTTFPTTTGWSSESIQPYPGIEYTVQWAMSSVAEYFDLGYWNQSSEYVPVDSYVSSPNCVYMMFTNCKLISKEFLTTYSNVKLSFKYFEHNVWGGAEADPVLKVYGRASTSDEWTLVSTITDNPEDWTTVNVSLPDGLCQVAFEKFVDNGLTTAIDDIVITGELGDGYNINYATSLTGGSISGNTTAEEGDEVTVTVTPDTHYYFSNMKVTKTGESSTVVYEGNSKVFTMPAYDVDVTATFTESPKFSITSCTAIPAAFGTVSYSPTEGLYEGTAVTLTATANEGYALGYYLVKGASGEVQVNGNQFTMPGEDVTIKAVFGVIAENEVEVLHEGFDANSMPPYNSTSTGWTQDAGFGDEPWMGKANASYTGGRCASHYLSTKKMVSPEMDLSDASSARMTFKLGTYYTYFYVYYRKSTADSWTQIGDYYYEYDANMTDRSVTLPEDALTSTCQLAFAVKAAGNWGSEYCVNFDELYVYKSMPKYSIAAVSENGTLAFDPASPVAPEETVTVSAAANVGYRLTGVTAVNDATGDNITVTENQFTMPKAPVTVTAAYDNVGYHNITIAKVGGGESTITVSEYVGEQPVGTVGNTVTITVNTAAGYALVDLAVKTASSEPVALTDNQFTMPNESVTITATFKNYIEIGHTASGSTQWLPIHKDNTYSMSEMIYNHSNYSTLDGGISINRICFWTGEDNVNSKTYEGVKVYMKPTTVDNYNDTAYIAFTSEDLVFTGDFTAPETANTQIVITLDKPFLLKNFDENILIGVYSENNATSVSPVKFYSFAATDCGNQWNEQITDINEYVPGGAGSKCSNLPALGIMYDMIPKHNISYMEATAAGSISGPATASEGATVTLVPAPAEMQRTGEITVTKADESGTCSVDESYKFIMPTCDVEVEAEFIQLYEVICSVTEGNGTLVPEPQYAAEGDVVTLTATPDDFYGVAGDPEVDYGGIEATKVDETHWTFTMPDYEVEASISFYEFEKYAINTLVEPESAGTVTISSDLGSSITESYAGVVITINPEANEGYAVPTIIVKDEDGGLVTVEDGQFTMPAKAVTVRVVFAEVEVVLSEGFEQVRGIPAGWTEINSYDATNRVPWRFIAGSDPDAGTEVVLDHAHGGDSNAMLSPTSYNSDSWTMLVTKEIDLSKCNPLSLEFYLALPLNTYGQPTLQVYYRNNTSKGDWTAFPDGAFTSDLTDWTHQTISLKGIPVSSAFQVAFKGSAPRYSHGVCIDDVVIYTAKMPSFAITYNECVNGSITGVESAKEGDKVKVEVTGDQGYKLSALTYNGGAGDVEIDYVTRTFTMPAYDVEVSAVFEFSDFCTVKTYVNSYITEHEVPVSTPWMLPEVGQIEGYDMVGWTDHKIYDHTAVPTFVDVEGVYTPYGDITLYAVYKKQGAEEYHTSFNAAITVAAVPFDGGEVTGEGIVPLGTEVTITAKPVEGCAFCGWFIKGTNTMFSGKPTYTFTATDDIDLEAKFTDKVIWVRVKKQ